MKTFLLSTAFMALAFPIAYSQSVPMGAQGTGRDSGIVSQPKQQQAATDASFVKKSTRSGLYQMAAAEIAMTTSRNPKIQSLATMILNDRQEANRRLAEIATKANFELPEKPSKAMRDRVEWLAKLKSDEFDALYAQQMVTAYLQDITLYEMVAERTNNAGLRTFIKETVPKLKNHLAEAQQLTNSASEPGVELQTATES